MCGISGISSFKDTDKGTDGTEAVRRMSDLQKHRGPDHTSMWASSERRCVFGHTRLSVIDLSPEGHQPMIDPETGNVIVYNGEIYNFPMLRAESIKEGYRFRSKTDTEVILALYRRYGPDCVKRLRGMFAFAIWEPKKQRVVLARDRLGEKPLHYALINGQLIFASEIRALVQHPLVSRDVDTEALELFLDLQYIPVPWTIYKDIRKLPPAHFAIFDASGFRLERYWELDYREKLKIDEEEALDALDEKLRECIRIRLLADVPIGATLSGGVDSGLVVAMLAKLTDHPVKTFTISFEEKAFDESRYAHDVAKRYGTDHYVHRIDSGIEALLPEMIRHYGEPYGDKSAVPSFFISRWAREQVTVALNGDGGDELLGGYSRYRLPNWRIAAASLLDNCFNPSNALEFIPRLQGGRSLPARVQRRLLLRYIYPELQSIGPFSSSYWGAGLRQDLLGEVSTEVVGGWRASLLDQALEHADHPIDRMLWLDTHTYLRDDGLVKIDIASMHCSLEARTPFVDHELMEFCASLPVTLKVRNGTGKYLLKKLAERYLSKHIVYRPKQGFSIPVSQWLRGPLLPFLEEVIFNRQLMEPFTTEVIHRIFNEFRNGNATHGHRLWLLLVYGIWRQTQRG